MQFARTDEMDADDGLLGAGGDEFVLADGLLSHVALEVRAVPKVHEAAVVHLCVAKEGVF